MKTKRHAFVAVYMGPGTRCGIGRADEGERGYTPQPQFGPYFSYDAAAEAAENLNRTLLGLTIEEECRIVASTMRR